VHGDVKALNVVIDADGRARLTDFARHASRVSTSWTVARQWRRRDGGGSGGGTRGGEGREKETAAEPRARRVGKVQGERRAGEGGLGRQEGRGASGSHG
jgi:hypothetical protein